MIIKSKRQKRKLHLRNFRHRVIMCRAADLITADGELQLKREAGYAARAAVEASRSSNYGFDGAAIFDARNQPSHNIIVNYRPEIDITATAWIYEAPRKSAPRWFKVIDWRDYDERGQHWLLRCRLHSRGDEVSKPADPDAAKFEPANPAKTINTLPGQF